MENRQQILEELRVVAPVLAEAGSNIPYMAPNGYFTSFPGVVMEYITQEAVLKNASAPTYEVPDGYFGNLPASILAAALKEGKPYMALEGELSEAAPLLNSLSKENIFAAPLGYFANADFVTAAIGGKSRGKVIGLPFARKWMQYAAAALVTGILVTGAFFYTDNQGYVGYERYSRLDVSSELHKVSAEDLSRYIDSHESLSAAITEPVAGAADESTDMVPVQSLSDEELKQYLQENSALQAAANH